MGKLQSFCRVDCHQGNFGPIRIILFIKICGKRHLGKEVGHAYILIPRLNASLYKIVQAREYLLKVFPLAD